LEGVILGGGVSRAATIFLPYLEKEFKKRMTMASADMVSIRISTLGGKSGILGQPKWPLNARIRRKAEHLDLFQQS
jgi:hypothetical protein